MDPEVILIDTDSDSDSVKGKGGTDTGFFIVSKAEKQDEPVETVSHSSSSVSSLPDLSLSDCEVSISDSATPIPVTTVVAVEPEKLRVGCMSRSPILQKFMKSGLLFNENPVSDERCISGTSCEVKANLNALFDSTLKRRVVDDCASDENSDLVRLSSEMPSVDADLDCLSRCVLGEQLNCSSNIPDNRLVSVADQANASIPGTGAKMPVKEEPCDLEASRPVKEEPSSDCKGVDGERSDDEDDDDLPCFLDVHQISKQRKQSPERKCGKNIKYEEEEPMEIVNDAEAEVYPTQTTISYSIDQLLAEHKETVRLRAMVVELNTEPCVALDEPPNKDDLLPEHKQELERINVVENNIRDVHPGENIFVSSDSRSLFTYPGSLTLASCGFRQGQSRTDKQLVTLPPDDLLEFLDPEFIDLVFPAISSKESFLRFIFYLLSVSPDSRVSRRLHRIVCQVIHGRKSTWTPSTLDICRIFVNYGAPLCRLCPDLSLLGFSEKELVFVEHEDFKENLDPSKNCNSTPAFELENLKFVLQIITDALAVRPENYSYNDCLVLTLILFRVGLDHQLSMGELHLDLEMFLAAVINAIPPDNWKDWVRDLCRRAVGIAEDHHNLVYLVGLLPLVERGVHLQRVLSLIFMLKYLPLANHFDDLLEPKVLHSLNFLETLQFKDKESDFYLTWSLVHLLEYSVGSEALPLEANDFSILISCLQLKISRIKDYINKIDHILLKDLMVLLVSKWNIMARTFGQRELFASGSGPVMVQSISSQVENDSEEEAHVDDR